MNKKDLLTLGDNNQYALVSKVTFENKDYVYLVDINNRTSIKFAEVEKCETGIDLLILNPNEKELINKLVPLFWEDCKDVFEEEQ